jgi:hypothetical protein
MPIPGRRTAIWRAIVSLLIKLKAFLPLYFSLSLCWGQGGGWTQTLVLRKMWSVLYHCATATGQVRRLPVVNLFIFIFIKNKTEIPFH